MNMMENSDNVNPKTNSVRDFFRSKVFWIPLIAVLIGGTGGFLYYYFIGCNSGSCAITSNPYGSIITGSLLGFILTSGSRQSGKI